MTRGLLAAAVLVLLVTAGGAGAFTDTVQRYPTGAISDFWSVTTTGTAATSIAQYPPLYPTSYTIKAYSSSSNSAGIYLSPYNTVSLSYFTFTVRDMQVAGQPANFYINYYDTNGMLIDSTSDLWITYLYPHHSNDIYEFIKAGTAIVLYLNGDSQGAIASVSDNTGYIEIQYSYSNAIWTNTLDVKLDDLSTEATPSA